MQQSLSQSSQIVKSFAFKGLDESYQTSRLQEMKELLSGIIAYSEAADMYITTAFEIMNYPDNNDECLTKVKSEIENLEKKVKAPMVKEFMSILGRWRSDSGLIRRLKRNTPIVNFLLDTAETFIKQAQNFEVPNP